MSFSITHGQSRIYKWISDRMPDQHYRGFHVLGVRYTDAWPRCGCCNQAIRSDPELAYSMFLNARYFWDSTEVNRDLLRGELLGIQNSDAIDSGGTFRNPEEYGIDPVREWMRKELGRSIVIADADYAVRRYGSRFGLSSEGDLMLIEKKEGWPRK